jgi:hypothetical protein
MPRMYTVSVENVAVTNANGDADLVELTAADDRPIELVGMGIYSLTEVQEAQEEWLRCCVVRGNTTTGNGTAATPRPTDPGDPAAGFTAKTYGSTLASAGTAVNLHPFGVQVRAGYEIFYPEHCSFITTQADGLLVVRLLAGPADDLNADLCFWVLEG